MLDFDMDENGVSTGDIHMSMQSALQKDKCIQKIRKKTRNGVILFVGDSLNDILASD